MIGLIWAQSANGIIGRRGDIPWSLPEDLAHFRKITTGCAVVMGRRTWESLPPFSRPLSGRRNIVITSDPEYSAIGAETVRSLDAAIAAGSETELWVIGGAHVYATAIQLADRLEVTELRGNFSGDTFAPAISPDFQLVSRSRWTRGLTPKLDHRFRRYIRPTAVLNNAAKES
jgi:dihydrofolate reductase